MLLFTPSLSLSHSHSIYLSICLSLHVIDSDSSKLKWSEGNKIRTPTDWNMKEDNDKNMLRCAILSIWNWMPLHATTKWYRMRNVSQTILPFSITFSKEKKNIFRSNDNFFFLHFQHNTNENTSKWRNLNTARVYLQMERMKKKRAKSGDQRRVK